MNATTNLYDILGGQGTIDAVVSEFYRRILADDRINHYFHGLDMDRQRQHQAAFVSQLLGGPQQYTGRSMAEAHARLHLSASDFNAVAGHLIATLEHFQVPQVHIDTIISAVSRFERDIVTRHTG